LAYSHGVYPLIYKTLKNYQDEIPSQTLVNMKLIYMDLVKQNMLMTKELLDVVKVLEENNILSIPLKGPVLSQMAYGDVVSRQYVDLDLLVDEDTFLKSVKILESNSFRFEDEFILDKFKEKRNIFHDLTLTNNLGVKIELHWRLFSDEYMTDFANIELYDNLCSVQINNQNIKTFSNEINLMYFCIHGAKHNWERIEWLLDIARFIENREINWDLVFEYVEKTNTQKIIYSTFLLCSKILDLKLEDKIIDRISSKKIIKLSKNFEKVFYEDFTIYLEDREPSKKITRIQFDLLKGVKNKSLFLLSLLEPTELDHKSLKLPKSLNFLYYFIRMYNLILKRSFKS
jgi:hypothetical protein